MSGESNLQIIAIGEILWDVFKDRECPGGAPLNFSVAAQLLGDSITLLTAMLFSGMRKKLTLTFNRAILTV